MFLQNKYTKWYYEIIKQASEDVNRSSSYISLEKHHILPRSLGGEDSIFNLVSLTPREHFICHLLLTKMLTGEAKSKMVYALMLMKSKSRWLDRENTTKYSFKFKNLYQQVEFTEEHRKNLSIAQIGKKRGPMSEEHKRKISEGNKGKNVGKIRSEETRQKLSAAHTGKSLGEYSEEHRANISKALKGKEKSESHRANISKAATGKNRSPHSDETKRKMSESHKGKPKDFSKISDADRKRRSDQMKALRARQKAEKLAQLTISTIET
jgi:5-methylcytosine-specific restriction endonuclease McrA